MENINNYFETTPNWITLMIIGAIIAIIIISSMKHHPFVGVMLVCILVFAFFGTNLTDYLADFDKDEIITEEKIENVQDKIVEYDNSGFFENLFDKNKDKESEKQDSEKSDELQEQNEKIKIFGINPEAVALIKQGFSNLFNTEKE